MFFGVYLENPSWVEIMPRNDPEWPEKLATNSTQQSALFMDISILQKSIFCFIFENAHSIFRCGKPEVINGILVEFPMMSAVSFTGVDVAACGVRWWTYFVQKNYYLLKISNGYRVEPNIIIGIGSKNCSK